MTLSHTQNWNFFSSPVQYIYKKIGFNKLKDLFKVVSKYTDWPVSSYSLKDLAQYLGFRWRDETPSGALSIQWFNEYIKTKEPKKLERILLYNEDDCKATMVLKEGIEKI